MSREAADELVEFLGSKVGENLRSVIRYDEDGGEVIHVRDDVRQEYTSAELDDVIADNRLEAIEKIHQESLYAHGELDCTVRCFEDAVEMHFIESGTEGTAVALDAEVFAIHGMFVGRCREIMGLI